MDSRFYIDAVEDGAHPVRHTGEAVALDQVRGGVLRLAATASGRVGTTPQDPLKKIRKMFRRTGPVLPQLSAGVAASGVAFSLLTFFWRSKRKQVARRGESRPTAFKEPTKPRSSSSLPLLRPRHSSNQAARIRMLRPIPYIPMAARLHNLPLVHHHHPISDIPHHR